MRIHQDDPTLILMSIPYGMSYDAGLHTLEQPRIRQWLKNYEKKQISMISLMRDTYVNIPGIGMRKLNAAHANGAGPLLLKKNVRRDCMQKNIVRNYLRSFQECFGNGNRSWGFKVPKLRSDLLIPSGVAATPEMEISPSACGLVLIRRNVSNM